MKMTRKQKRFCTAICLLAAFVLWTALLYIVDVRPIGPQGSQVGFASMNRWVHERTGVSMSLYTVTDWLGLVPIAVAMGFAIFGLWQLIRRKSLLRVDRDVLALGVFYLAVMAVFVLFEVVVVNRRPVLIDGILEASYPSSTTMLVMCVIPTAMMQLHARVRHKVLRVSVLLLLTAFVAFMVIGRLLSGVHWMSDIIGGALVSAGLVMLYAAFGMTEHQ